ncbi:anoctamin-9 [Tachyglossus aculeatus]|uniref:anoctamin-9 n=1 Tax=Tachyglossus aculeatus TaxID=9261 RepID=UPI0018F35A53|nr:anoctamin-9 [Tachyglossus aculeatus]
MVGPGACWDAESPGPPRIMTGLVVLLRGHGRPRGILGRRGPRDSRRALPGPEAFWDSESLGPPRSTPGLMVLLGSQGWPRGILGRLVSRAALEHAGTLAAAAEHAGTRGPTEEPWLAPGHSGTPSLSVRTRLGQPRSAPGPVGVLNNPGRPRGILGHRRAAEHAGTRGHSGDNGILFVPRRENFQLMDLGTQEKFDFVLVSDLSKNSNKKDVKRRRFFDELSRKGFTIKKIEDQNKMFYGIRAGSGLFHQYQGLLKQPDCIPQPPGGLGDDVPETTRIRIVNFILTKMVVDEERLEDLIQHHVFETKFPLHKEGRTASSGWQREGDRAQGSAWKTGWFRGLFFPWKIDDIRDYFGEKVALYFAWLGWYTLMLLPATLAGLITFFSGFSLFHASQISIEICQANETIMCPLCDQNCPYWRLSDICTFSKITHLFDNEGTVIFAILMALWATVFLELWKRQRAQDVSGWNLYLWDQDEEELALELINSSDHQSPGYQHSYLRSSVVLFLSLIMICLAIGIAQALVVYRVLSVAFFSNSQWDFLRQQANTVAIVTGALAHYLTIILMTKVNRLVALKLCAYEKQRNFSERENSFTVKFFTFQFFTHFSSLIYTAFFLGRINGHPGKYVRIAGQWRLEECHPSGCMMDLFVQMAVIMGLKQTLNNCVEYLVPWLKHRFRQLRGSPQGKGSGEMGKESEVDSCLEQWLDNYVLNEINVFSLFDEFMEMMIQYSFTTIFVAAFPLAPLLALFNNLVEIRLDAFKMTRLQRRLVPRKAKDIGIWLQVLEAIGVLAVIANGLVIAFTSEFIPRLVYKYRYGPCRDRATDNCLMGYVNHSLSVFYIKDLQDSKGFQESNSEHPGNITECRYRDYRNPNDYDFSEQFWFILAIRLAFVIIFEHVALCIKLVAAWFVPDVPQSVKNDLLREKQCGLMKRLSSRCTDV